MRENELLEPLFNWLDRTGRVRPGTIVVQELPWMGRRVDLVTLTSSGILTAYELKVGHNLKAIEQAAKNALAFNRSFIVTATVPSEQNLRMASGMGVGVISVHDRLVRSLMPAARRRPESRVSRRLKHVIRAKAVSVGV